MLIPKKIIFLSLTSFILIQCAHKPKSASVSCNRDEPGIKFCMNATQKGVDKIKCEYPFVESKKCSEQDASLKCFKFKEKEKGKEKEKEKEQITDLFVYFKSSLPSDEIDLLKSNMKRVCEDQGGEYTDNTPSKKPKTKKPKSASISCNRDKSGVKTCMNYTKTGVDKIKCEHPFVESKKCSEQDASLKCLKVKVKNETSDLFINFVSATPSEVIDEVKIGFESWCAKIGGEYTDNTSK